MEQQKRYSDMSEFELHQEIGRLNEKAKKAEQMGMVNEFEVYERKMAMAKAYLTNPSMFEAEKSYEMIEDPGNCFTISYINGRFAWGHRKNDPKLEAVPISLLGNEVNEKEKE